MNKEQQEICEQILHKILSIPISKLFLECPLDVSREKIEKPITLHFISDKLNTHHYKSPINFISDIRLLLGNQLQIEFVDPFKKEAAIYLSNFFEELIKKKSPNSNDPTLLLSSFDEKLADIQNELSIVLELKETTKEEGGKEEEGKEGEEEEEEEGESKEGASEIVNQTRLLYSIANTKYLLSLLHSHELLAYAGIYLQKIQPEAVIFDPSLVFDFSIMTVPTRRKFCKFVRRLLRDAASGRISL
ncbi:hypothetical protein GPJ56_006736 [Histomonas meleagridis]|uniref:uncharacterized protein n=1 Tax=Histomonas meleagridis TaxID=135588 RepID=UPI00355ABECC|nr:hypothetical protein GPJ56_006736 [Histomonas meleagridis]KAH0806969.1 hypothetical protein GO595_000145 [Histomonas meleagridis]